MTPASTNAFTMVWPDSSMMIGVPVAFGAMRRTARVKFVRTAALLLSPLGTACTRNSPAGLTQSGLPVGLQMIAPSRGDAKLLAGAKMLEDMLGVRGTTPIDPKPAR